MRSRAGLDTLLIVELISSSITYDHQSEVRLFIVNKSREEWVIILIG